MAYDKEKRRITAKKWRDANPEKVAAAERRSYLKHRERRLKKKREWHAVNRDKNRAEHLRRKFGLTLAEFNAMRDSQGGKCAGCATTMLPGWDTNVDHCHTTGLIRGLLCRKCNLAIGMVADSPETLETLAAYLRAARE